MSTNFPTSLDSLTNPIGTNRLNSPDHAAQHSNANDAITALETKVGVDSSAVTTTLDYKLKNTASTNPGHKHTLTATAFTDVIVTTPANSDIIQYSTGNNKWNNVPTPFHFGGTGADGDLTITSGTTTVDLGSAAVVVKNYTTISITGSGKLAFSNPHANGTVVILKSQGAVTITATAPCINASGIGAAAGAGVTGNSNGTAGTKGISQISFWLSATAAQPGQFNATFSSAAGGDGETIKTISNTYNSASTQLNSAKYPNTFVGGGGASGGSYTNSGTVTSGAGGRGGGGLIIECGGAWNFTTASGITVAGVAGGTGSLASGTGIIGGGGGGGGGYLLILYNSLTANSGTVITTGGAAANGQQTTTYANNGAGGGGAGGSYQAGGSGSTPPGAGQVWGASGTGAAGFSFVGANTEFA